VEIKFARVMLGIRVLHRGMTSRNSGCTLATWCFVHLSQMGILLVSAKAGTEAPYDGHRNLKSTQGAAQLFSAHQARADGVDLMMLPWLVSS